MRESSFVAGADSALDPRLRGDDEEGGDGEEGGGLRHPFSSFAFLPLAISSIVRPVLMLVRKRSVRPRLEPACSSLTLRRIQFSVRSPGRGLRRNMIHSPFIRWPASVKWRWPSSIVLRGSLRGSGVQVPQSHSITVPPPYSPLGIVPSNVA